MASEYVKKDGKFIPIGGKADIVDGKNLKAGRWYIVEGGKWVEVDFSDNIFSRVISNKSGVKKVKTDKGKVLFVVSDDNGNSAHGETIAKAREDLVYKAVAKYDGKIPEKATGKEWVGIYRAIIDVSASQALMHVAAKITMLAEALHNYEQAQKLTTKKGRLRIWMPER